MITSRTCAECGKKFDAIVYKDHNIYCPLCREKMGLEVPEESQKEYGIDIPEPYPAEYDEWGEEPIGGPQYNDVVIAVRTCIRCGETFDAVVGEDNNIYCSSCRETIEFEEEILADEEIDLNEIGIVNALLSPDNEQLFSDTGDERVKNPDIADVDDSIFDELDNLAL